MKSFTILKRVALTAVYIVVANESRGQSFNLDMDMDIGAGSEAVGNGVPSSDFGAAANQPGFWNRLGAAQHTHAYPLLDLDGNVSAATISWNATGGGRGSGWIGNTGDHRLLLNDCTLITVPTTYVFENLTPGNYKVITYAVDRSGDIFPTRITVNGANEPVKISGNGSMPGDQLIEGITHSIHEVTIAGASFSVMAESVLAGPKYGAVNGFQISYQPVPEPLSFIGLLTGIGLVAMRRRNSAPA